jgi:5-carboxymethyl-2-hydroxymuconate isomerase
MPHFILDCSESLLSVHDKQQIMQNVMDVAVESGLFGVDDIKVRVRPYADFMTGTARRDFIHVFGYIMDGRTTEQKHDLSHSVVSRLKSLLPDVPIVSMNVMEFEKATYNHRNTVE